MTDAELQDRFVKGLCYRCDEKFGPGHICANKQFQVLILEEGEEGMNEERRGTESEAELKNLQLSLYSITGLTSKKSIKVWGELDGSKVVVLVDCGASHNFISSMLVRDKGILITITPPYTVEVGDGRKIKSEGVCKQLVLQVQGLKILQDFFIFELRGVDVVLGMEWLAGLGKIRANFKELTLKVPTATGTQVLKGEPAMARSAASYKKC